MKKKIDFKKLFRDKRFIACCIAAVLILFVSCFFFPTGESQNSRSDSALSDIQDSNNPRYYPFVSRKVKEAYDKNRDVTGWLKIENCDIDNPVFQGKDNNEYLRVDEEGNYSVWGCYFLDYINVNDGYTLNDRVNIIYGHSLDDTPESEKFSKLKRYKDKDFALENDIITFDLLYRQQDWQIFAVCDIPITIDYIDPNPKADKEKDTLSYITKHSYVDFGKEAQPDKDDTLLILSTCTSDENVRFIVAAKLVKEDNSGD